jgi:hypothetical protein
LAGINEILVGKFQEGLSRLFRTTGNNPSPALSPDVSPSVSWLEGPCDWAWLRKEQLCQGGGVQAIGANPGFIQLQNPLGSGVLARLEAIILATPTAVTVQMHLTSIFAGAAMGGNGFRDGRTLANPTQVPVCAAFSGTQVLINSGAAVIVPANTTIVVPAEWVVTPGTAVELQANGNAQLAAALIWREKELLPEWVR